MSGDNRIFNVNGRSEALLLQTLRLAFEQSGYKGAEGYLIDPDKGLILVWHINASDKSLAFPSIMDAESVYPTVLSWLRSKPTTKCDGWDADADHDGSNELGWRVYCEDWGHVKTHYAIVAVKPAYIWYGK